MSTVNSIQTLFDWKDTTLKISSGSISLTECRFWWLCNGRLYADYRSEESGVKTLYPSSSQILKPRRGREVWYYFPRVILELSSNKWAEFAFKVGFVRKIGVRLHRRVLQWCWTFANPSVHSGKTGPKRRPTVNIRSTWPKLPTFSSLFGILPWDLRCKVWLMAAERPSCLLAYRLSLFHPRCEASNLEMRRIGCSLSRSADTILFSW